MPVSLEDDLKLERYKLVTDRQKYFTELARSAFASYIKVFIGLAAGGITLISASLKLELKPELLQPLVNVISCLVIFLGFVTIGQIIFCLIRWRGYRKAETEINPDSPPIKGWYWVFEGLYCVAIAISIVAIWFVPGYLLAAI